MVARTGMQQVHPCRLRSMFAVVAVALAASALLAALPARASAGGVDDWVHIWEVVRLATYHQTQSTPPQGLFVYYLGDSTGREATISDASWTRALARKAVAAGKIRVSAAYDVSGHNQTFGMDEKVVEGLPATPSGQPSGIVLISVGISRFIGPPTPMDPAVLPVSTPGAPPPLSPWVQHHYDTRRPLPLAAKRELVPLWMEHHWTDFKANRAANVARIKSVIKLCKSKGLRPVLIDQPLDLRVVGSALGGPRSAIRTAMMSLAKKNHIDYIRFNKSLSLPSSSFWDLHHLRKPGYERWQVRLTNELVKRLPKAN